MRILYNVSPYETTTTCTRLSFFASFGRVYILKTSYWLKKTSYQCLKKMRNILISTILMFIPANKKENQQNLRPRFAVLYLYRHSIVSKSDMDEYMHYFTSDLKLRLSSPLKSSSSSTSVELSFKALSFLLFFSLNLLSLSLSLCNNFSLPKPFFSTNGIQQSR